MKSLGNLMIWRNLLDLLKEAKMVGNVAPATFRGKRKADKKLCEKTLENILICNGIENVF